MNTHSLCCIGYITQDKVVTPKNTIYMPGGTSFYFAHAIKHLNASDFLLITALADTDMGVVEDIRKEFPSKPCTAHIPYVSRIFMEKTRTNVHNASRQKQTLSPWKV